MRRALFVSAWSIGVCALGVALYQHAETQKEKAIYSTRGFYGVLHVYEYNRNEETIIGHSITEGSIMGAMAERNTPGPPPPITPQTRESAWH